MVVAYARVRAPIDTDNVLLGAIGFGSGVAGLSGAPLMFGMLMDAHHPGWVFIGIGAFQALSLIAVLGVGEQAGKRQVQAA